MIHRIIPTAAARNDIMDIADYFYEKSPAVAAKFLQSIDTTYDQIVRMPELGTKKSFADSDMQNIRIRPVDKHRNYLMFYRVENNSIYILRVLHGARDYEGMFEH